MHVMNLHSNGSKYVSPIIYACCLSFCDGITLPKNDFKVERPLYVSLPNNTTPHTIYLQLQYICNLQYKTAEERMNLWCIGLMTDGLNPHQVLWFDHSRICCWNQFISPSNCATRFPVISQQVTIPGSQPQKQKPPVVC